MLTRAALSALRDLMREQAPLPADLRLLAVAVLAAIGWLAPCALASLLVFDFTILAAMWTSPREEE
jgi:hypothetical protein